MKAIQYHNVESISLDEIANYERGEKNSEFYHRTMTIKMTDGTTETIGLFADSGYALIPNDVEADQLKRAA